MNWKPWRHQEVRWRSKQPMVKCRRMKRLHTVHCGEFDVFLTTKLLEDTPAVLSLGKLCDEHVILMSGSTVKKPHLIKNGIRKNFVPLVVPGTSKTPSSSSTSTLTTPSREIDHSDQPPAIVSSERVDIQVRRDLYFSETSGELLNKPTKIPKTNKKENHEEVRGDPYYSDTPEWLQEFRENLVDDRIPERRDTRQFFSWTIFTAYAGKHSVCSHFPKDRNCYICQRTKITSPVKKTYWQSRPSCRKFGWFACSRSQSAQ